MGMRLSVYCDMCFPALRPELEFDIEAPKDLERDALKARIEGQGWIVQLVNDGKDMLTYCTKKCAE